MIDFYRETPLPWLLVENPRLRWTLVRCNDEECEGHRRGVLGLTVCGLERWMVQVVGGGLSPDSTEDDWEEGIAGLSDEIVHGYEVALAAFGLPWEVLDFVQLERQRHLIEGLPSPAVTELHDQGAEALLGMRRLVGRDLAAMPVLLNAMGRYRESSATGGGVRLREGFKP